MHVSKLDQNATRTNAGSLVHHKKGTTRYVQWNGARHDVARGPSGAATRSGTELPFRVADRVRFGTPLGPRADEGSRAGVANALRDRGRNSPRCADASRTRRSGPGGGGRRSVRPGAIVPRSLGGAAAIASSLRGVRAEPF